MALELKILSPSEEGFVKEIIWNADEISAAVAEKMSFYKGLVYSDDQIIEAKKDRAALNEYLAGEPYVAEGVWQKIVVEPMNVVLVNGEKNEDAQRAAKLEAIRGLFNAKGFQPWVTLDRIMNDSWLNKSYSLKKVETELTSIQHSIGEDLLLINSMGEGQPAALREYQRTLSKTAAVEAGQRFIEAKYAEQRLTETVKRQQEEAARQKQAEIDRDLGIAEPEAVPEPVPVQSAPAQQEVQQQEVQQPEVKRIAFIAWLSREQFNALNNCIKQNHIRVQQLRKGSDQKWQ